MGTSIFPGLRKFLKNCGNYFPKRDARLSFPPFSWGRGMPLIGQAAHVRMARIIVLTAWPIRGIPFPLENGGKLSLTALFGYYIKNVAHQKRRSSPLEDWHDHCHQLNLVSHAHTCIT